MNESGKPLIIVSNHISFYDSFLFRLVSSYSHLPLRFMAVDAFQWPFLIFLGRIGFVKFVYSLFGVFVVFPGKGIEVNLKKPKEIISSGGVVVIYPEGHINDSDVLADFKKGAAVLALETGARVLPVAFRLKPNTLWRRQVGVSIGKAFSLPKGCSHKTGTEILKKKVSELFCQI